MNFNEFSDKLFSRCLSRRQMLKMLGVVGIGMAVVPMSRTASAATEQATYFTWAGYDDNRLFGPYIEKHGAAPNYAAFGDSEEALQILRGGFVVDVSHPCDSSIPRWVQSGLFQPIDVSRLEHWPNVVNKLKEFRGAQQDGKQWFAPMEWGQTSITYRKDLVELPGGEESWRILWDEKNKGKIGVINAAAYTWWCAAILAGVSFENISDADYDTVNELLRKQRPLVRMYSNDMTMMEQALATGELVAAMTWNESLGNLKKQDVDVAWANPKEGALTWVCGAMIHSDAPSLDKAHDIINSLQSPEVGKYIIEEYGYGHCNAKSFDIVQPKRLAELGLTRNPADMLDAGHFQVPQTQEFETKMNADYAEIRAGF